MSTVLRNRVGYRRPWDVFLIPVRRLIFRSWCVHGWVEPRSTPDEKAPPLIQLQDEISLETSRFVLGFRVTSQYS